MSTPSAADALSLLYQDEDLVVVTKPSGLPTTHPSQGRCLVSEAMGRFGGPLHPSSRLDAEVTGIVILARGKTAIKGLLEARRKDAYLRRYIGLTAVAPNPVEGVFDASIAIDPRDKRRRVAIDEPRGKERGIREAVTHYRTLVVTEHGAAVELRPETGRTHQLRVHLEHAERPLVGDVHYGGARRIILAEGRVATARRVMLHCRAVSVPHPRTGERLRFEAPFPPDFASIGTALLGPDWARVK